MIVTVAATKGGVGKSTLVALLAFAAHRRGLAVLVVDLDHQGSAALWVGEALSVRLADPTPEALAGLDRPGQLTLIDTPPGATPAALAGVRAADLVIAAAGPGWEEQRAMIHVERMVDVDLVVITRFDRRKRRHKDGLARARERYGERLAGVVPLRTSVEDAQANGEPVPYDTRSTDDNPGPAEVMDGVLERLLPRLEAQRA